ncbi:MAG: hypothetical protein WD042_13760 [Phycisphaeraceae bacterium]
MSFAIRHRWSSCLLLIAALLMPAGVLGAAEADYKAALAQAPADAAIVVVVPNMKAFSDKIAQLNNQLGLTNPDMANALGKFKRETGISQGLKEDGPFVMMITDMSGLGNEEVKEPPLAALFPVTSYSEFLKNFKDTATEDGITVGKTDAQGGDEPAYIKQLGDYALVGNTLQVVQNYKAGGDGDKWIKAMGAMGRKYLGPSDAVVLFNMPVMAEKLKEQMAKGMAEMEKQMAQVPGQDMALNKIVMGIYHNIGQQFVEDTDVAMASVDMGDMGMGVTWTAQFKSASKMASIFSTGAAGGDALTKVPEQPYLFAWGLNFKGIDTKALVADLQKKLQGQDVGAMGKIVLSKLPLVEKIESYAQAYYVPKQVAMGGAGLFNGVTVIQTNDAEGLIAGTKEYLTELGKVQIPAGQDANGEPLAMSMTTSYNVGVMKLDDVSVDQYSFSLNMPPQAMRGNPMAPMMQMLGLTAQSGYIAKRGNHVIVTTGVDAATLQAALNSSKNSDGLGADDVIKEVRQTVLPKDASFEGYLSLGGIANTANLFMVMFGGQAIQVPANLPPVASGLAIQDSGVAGRTFVPISVMNFVKSTIMQFQAQQQPGPGPGGQDGPPPAPF